MNCQLCGNRFLESGDSWAGLCPACADRVSELMDQEDIDREDAIEALANNY